MRNMSNLTFRGILAFAAFAPTLILASASATAANYYVRTDGSDTNCNGSANAASSSAPNCAFSTVQKSVAVATAGDLVTIQAGNYSGNINFNRSGTASAPITFKGVNSVFKGSITTSGSYIVLDGITVSPTSYTAYGAITVSGQRNVLKNCLVTNYGASAGDQATAIVLDSSGAYNTVDGCTIRDLNDIDVFHINGHDQTIRNNKISNITLVNYSLNHTDIFQSWGWSGSTSYNIVIEGNQVYDSNCQLGNLSNDGNANQRDWTFRNNVFANVGAALFSGIPKIKYYNNVFYKVGAAQGYAVSLYTQTDYSSVGDEFVNNVFIGNSEDVNIHSGSQADVAAFKNNYFANANYTAKTNGEWMGSGFINGGNAAFVNLAGYDFHLQSGSVLIGKGYNLSSTFTTDKDGKVRSTWDIGPYAYNGSSPAPFLPAPSNLRVVP